MPISRPDAYNLDQRSPETAGAGAPFWSLTAGRLADRLGSGPAGLTAAEAERRLRFRGRNTVGEDRSASALLIAARRIESPLVPILVFAAVTAAVLRQWTDARGGGQ